MAFDFKKRIRLKPNRKRLAVQVDVIQPKRSSDYLRLRYFWIMELYWLRAKHKAGTGSLKEIKAAQRALAKVRVEG